MSYVEENAGAAFGLVIAAGAATGIGAAVVFFPSLARLANRKALAASLGLSAGVMMYVSFVDIYGKAISGFEEADHSEENAFIYTTFSFFGGIFMMMLLNKLVDAMMGLDRENARRTLVAQNEAKAAAPPCCHGEDPVEELEQIQKMAEEVEQGTAPHAQDKDVEGSEPTEATAEELAKPHADELMVMGTATAIAIALHNLPEGLVTFLAYMEDPTVGIVLAIGIAIHNVPEGLCVAMPVYYATGNRLKAFAWGILSGVSEPIGALIGWAVLKGPFNGNVNGVMFGIVAGIMTLIAADELLPTAHKYDPTGKIVTPCFILGMAAIAGSLVLFSL